MGARATLSLTKINAVMNDDIKYNFILILSSLMKVYLILARRSKLLLLTKGNMPNELSRSTWFGVA